MLHFALLSVDCKGEVKLLMRYATIRSISYAMHGSISYAMHRSTNSIARQVATVASRLRFDASSATCFAHKPLNASLRSFVRGLQGRSQALDTLRKAWNISYARHGSTNSIARQVATVASRLRFDTLPPHTLRTSPWMLHFALSSMTARTKSSCRCAAQLLEISDI